MDKIPYIYISALKYIFIFTVLLDYKPHILKLICHFPFPDSLKLTKKMIKQTKIKTSKMHMMTGKSRLFSIDSNLYLFMFHMYFITAFLCLFLQSGGGDFAGDS